MVHNTSPPLTVSNSTNTMCRHHQPSSGGISRAPLLPTIIEFSSIVDTSIRTIFKIYIRLNLYLGGPIDCHPYLDLVFGVIDTIGFTFIVFQIPVLHVHDI